MVDGNGVLVATLLVVGIVTLASVVDALRRRQWVWALGMLVHPPLMAWYFLRRGDPSAAEMRRRATPIAIVVLVVMVVVGVWVAVTVHAGMGAVFVLIAVAFGALAFLGPRLSGERSDPPPVRRASGK